MWLLGTEPGSSEKQCAPELSHLASALSSSLGCTRLFTAVVNGIDVCVVLVLNLLHSLAFPVLLLVCVASLGPCMQNHVTVGSGRSLPLQRCTAAVKQQVFLSLTSGRCFSTVDSCGPVDPDVYSQSSHLAAGCRLLPASSLVPSGDLLTSYLPPAALQRPCTVCACMPGRGAPPVLTLSLSSLAA